MNKFDIIYEDKDILLCHKPAGIATQTKRLGQQDMESLLKNYRVKKGEQPYIGIVHRLDQPVEGMIVFAKNTKAAAVLSKQIQNRMIGKYYYAVSKFAPETEQGVLENYLLTDKKTNVTKVLMKNFDLQDDSSVCESEKADLRKNSKFAKLEYQVLAQKEEKTLFDIKLHTGRQHQIRVQMAHIGCPLVGDSKYGNQRYEDGQGVKSPKIRETLGLCSYKLEFQHPSTGKEMVFTIVPKGAVFQEFFVSKS